MWRATCLAAAILALSPAAEVSPAGSDADLLCAQALAEPALEPQVAGLVEALRQGSVPALARLIELTRWNDLGLVDPRVPPLAAWAEDATSLGPWTVRQLHGLHAANWAVRHPGAYAADPHAQADALRRPMREALALLLEDRCTHPVLLCELAWLVQDYVEQGQQRESLQIRRRAIRCMLDGAVEWDPLHLQARLKILLRAIEEEQHVSAESAAQLMVGMPLAEAQGWYDLALDCQTRLLERWTRLLPQPPVGGGAADISGQEEVFRHWLRILSLAESAQDQRWRHQALSVLSIMQEPIKAPDDDPVVAEVAWAAALTSHRQALAVADGPMARARSLLRLAWCLHRGSARYAPGLEEACTIYEQVESEVAAASDSAREAGDSLDDLASLARANRTWCQGASEPGQIFWDSMSSGRDAPDLWWTMSGTRVAIRGHRIGREATDQGTCAELAWFDEAQGKPAFSGDWRLGRRHGRWSWWHENGQLAATGDYEMGAQIGRWRWLHANGQLWREVLADGQLFTGTVVEHAEDGSITNTSIWLDGMRVEAPRSPSPLDGPVQEPHAQGGTARGQLRDGLRDGPWTFVRADGSREEEVGYRLGLRHGPGRTWHPGDVPASVGAWRCGLLDGTWQEFAADGSLRRTAGYRLGLLHGKDYSYHADGIRASEGIWDHGRKAGPCRTWHPDGVLASESGVHDRQGRGIRRTWYPDGTLETYLRTRVDGSLEWEVRYFRTGALNRIDYYGIDPQDRALTLFHPDGTALQLEREDGSLIPAAELPNDLEEPAPDAP